MPRLMLSFSRAELIATGYPVIVEGWDKVVGRYQCGSKRRRYLQSFTEQERRYLSKLYPELYRWYLVTGTPESKVFVPSKFGLLQRACNFFATI